MLSRRSQTLFLLLVIVQVAHSAEEYFTRLFDVLAPARFLSGLFSDDLATGFAILNALIILVGIVCYVGPVRAGGRAGRTVATVWVVIELANGAAHVVLALLAGGYFSGAVTAVLHLVVASLLAHSLSKDQ